MREADDIPISKGSLYVDSRDTTLHHIGELMPPAAGVMNKAHVKEELYDLIGKEHSARTFDDKITVFKNDGAHPDLMSADYIAQAVGGKT